MLENPDPTSGNFLEQIPKTLLLVLAFLLMVDPSTSSGPGLETVIAVEGFVLGLGAVALLVHQWFFTWPPAPSLTPTRLVAQDGQRRCKRFIAIVIDGCRADRLREADTPIAVIIPAHNEEENLPSTLSRIPREGLHNPHVIVVDDGSTDRSAEIARQHGADTVVSHPRNLGLAACPRNTGGLQFWV